MQSNERNNNELIGLTLLRMGQVCALTGLARTTIYELQRDGLFPKRIKIGRISVWIQREVIQWIESKISGSRGELP